MSDAHLSTRWNRFWLALVWLVLYGSFTLIAPPLLDDADSVHAEVAREMLVRHDYVTLYANGIRYLEKAPLYYWSMAASMRVFGVSAAAARVPLALAVLALALLLEAFARRAWGSARAGFYAGLMTLTSFGIFIFSRIDIPDVLVCVWLTAALLCYLLSEREAEPGRAVCWGFALACALDVLTKGLIGIVFPLAIVWLHLLATRGWRAGRARVRALRPWSSALVFFVVATPWHVLAALANPGHGHPGDLARVGGHWQVPLPTDGNVHGWAWFYFINEQVYRYLNVRVPHDYDTAPLWLFLGLILVWLLPWSALLPGTLLPVVPAEERGWRERARAHTLTQPERTRLLLLLWCGLPLVFFSLSTRQEYYVLPSLPPLLVLMARFLWDSSRHGNAGEAHGVALLAADNELRRVARAGRSALRAAWWMAGLGTLVAGILLLFLLQTRAPAPGTDLASLLAQNPADYALSFGHFLDLNARASGLFRLPLAITAVVVFAGGWGHLLLRRRQRPHAATLLLAGCAVGFLVAAWLGLRTFSPVLSSAAFADVLRPQLQPDDLLVLHGEYEAGSTLGFYLRRNDLHIVEGRSSNLWYGSFFPDAPAIFETRESIAAKWAGPRRIFLWEDPHDPERKPLVLPVPVYTIAQGGGKVLLSNQQAGAWRAEATGR